MADLAAHHGHHPGALLVPLPQAAPEQAQASGAPPTDETHGEALPGQELHQGRLGQPPKAKRRGGSSAGGGG